MKILLVDDESNKLKALMQVLKSIKGLTEDNVTHVLDLNSAKRELLSTSYNFMVLDLNIPESLGESPEAHAGEEFVDEIIEVDNYIKPQEIIILTEYDISETHFKENLDYIGFTILKYSSTNNNWQAIIKSKICYSMICEKQKNTKPKCDVAIITAVPIEGHAVRKISDSWSHQKFPGDSTFYFETQLVGKDKMINVVHAQQSEMGMHAAAALTTKLINYYNPRYIIMPGIAAGIKKDNYLGDIIIPTEIWNYCSGKYISVESGNEDDDLLKWVPDPKYATLNPQIRDMIMQQDYADVLQKIRCSYPGEKPQNDLHIINGPLACGNAVVSNFKIVKQLILDHARKTIGLDMESYGLFFAAMNINNQETIPICVKSICDYADKNKGDDLQNYAAYTSAEFTKYLILNQLEY